MWGMVNTIWIKVILDFYLNEYFKFGFYLLSGFSCLPIHFKHGFLQRGILRALYKFIEFWEKVKYRNLKRRWKDSYKFILCNKRKKGFGQINVKLLGT
jgi:hypothetical protein